MNAPPSNPPPTFPVPPQPLLSMPIIHMPPPALKSGSTTTAQAHAPTASQSVVVTTTEMGEEPQTKWEEPQSKSVALNIPSAESEGKSAKEKIRDWIQSQVHTVQCDVCTCTEICTYCTML